VRYLAFCVRAIQLLQLLGPGKTTFEYTWHNHATLVHVLPDCLHWHAADCSYVLCQSWL
jgi:hypothetical protein